MTFRVDLAVYNGPMDLLLYLARRQEVSLAEVSLAKIIDQYGDYLELLQELDLAEIGDFLELASTRSPISAVFSVVTLSPYHACSVVPKDQVLRAGQRPWCIVAVPEGNEELLEHELRHCEGWAAPKPKTARIRDWPEDQDS